MAYPGEISKGDTVRWRDYFSGELEGEVVRCAKDGTWCDVRYPVQLSIFPDVTHLTKRVRVTKLQLVRKAGGS